MHFTESELQQHEELIITRALAKKDREIADMMAHNAALGQSLSNALQREKVLMDELDKLRK